MSKLQRDAVELTYVNAGSIRAEDIPVDASSSIKALLDRLVPYITTFVNADLTAGVLAITHNKGYQSLPVYVLDNNNVQVDPDSVTYDDDNNISVDLTSQGTITGTWTITVR